VDDQSRSSTTEHWTQQKERDDLTGLYYYGARYYAPWLGRWMSADPSGPQDGLNLYEYVSSNPIGYIDPDGNEKKEPGSFKKAWDFSLGFLKAAGKFANENATMMLESHPLSPMFDPKAVWDRNMNMYNYLYNQYRLGGGGKEGLFNAGKQLLPLTRAKRGLDQARVSLEHGDYDKAGEHSFEFAIDYGGFLVSVGLAAKTPPSSKTTIVPETPPAPKPKRGNIYNPFRKKKKAGIETIAPDEVISASSKLTGRGDPLAAAANRIKPLENFYDVVIHGSPESFHVLHNGKWVKIDQRSLASFMKKTGYEGGPVRLISCSAGKSSTGVAKNLANKLGEVVKAPTDTLWIHPSGKMTIGPKATKNTGNWKNFIPGGN